MVTRILSAVIVLVVVVYHALRLMAAQCGGAACDVYIPLSLLLPITALVLAAVTGGIAANAARAEPGPWTAILAGCGVLGSIGPIATGLLIKDNDVLVWLSTILVLTVPLSVGAHAAMRSQARA